MAGDAPGLSLREQLPVLLLVGLLLALSLAVAYPAKAYPLHGMGFTLLLVLGGTLALLLRGAVPWILAAASAGWALLWLVRWPTAPVPTEGTADVATALVAAQAGILAAVAVACWPKSVDPQQGAPAGGRLGALEVTSGWLGALVALAAAYGIYQSLGPAWLPRTFRSMEQALLELPATDPLREGLLHAARERRASGPFGAPNIFASFLAFGIPLAVAWAVGARRLWAKALWAVGALLMGAGVALSGSRGGTLAAAGGGGLLGILLLAARFRPGQILRMAGAAALLLGILAGALLLVLSKADVADNRWLGATGMTNRFRYWQSAASVWRESPLLGRGPGAFAVLYPERRIAGADETKHAHSWPMENAAAVGVAGVGLLALVLAAGAFAGVRLLASGVPEDPGVAPAPTHAVAGLTAALAAITAHGFMEYTFSFREAAAFAFVAAGALAGAAAARFPARGVPATVAGAVVLGLAIPFPWVQARPAKVERLLDDAYYLGQEGAAPREVLAVYSELLALDPSNPSVWEARGEYRVATGDASGIKDLEKAITLNPWSARLEEKMARLLESRGDVVGALQHQERAVERHPLDVSHRYTLAEMLLRQDRRLEALAAYEATRPLVVLSRAERRRQALLEQALGLPLSYPKALEDSP